ncbi:MAG: hydroxymethylbilane synthase [PVC group bacterium]|nr:hydroxymethylbilane synthase [PVC group bacterium]
MRSANIVVIGTRKSALAQAQANKVLFDLQKHFSDYKFKIKKITTTGDRLKSWPQTAGKGLFVKEIEEALIQGEIDIAVHSMKDLPCDMPQGLEIAAITKRLSPQDILISRSGKRLIDLPAQSRIGTSSLRRKTQLKAYRSDLKVVDIRGNLDSRLKKLKEGKYDAIVLAAAGVLRLGWDDVIAEILPFKVMLPAPAQGALGIEVRKNDRRIKRLVKILNHEISAIEINAERAFLQAMGGGCRTPLGALARIKRNILKLEGVIAGGKDDNIMRNKVSGMKKFPKRLGRKLAAQIKVCMKDLIRQETAC